MNQFGLIIQETTAGSNQQFVSSHLDINSSEIKETITDERTLASQLANLSDVYSVQITKNYKVYSLIVTNLTDFLGRSGYYAIRLYGPKGVNLTNFETILANIKEKYNNYTKTNTLNNQNYDDILSNILIVENDRKNFFTTKSYINCFYYFDDANSTLSTVFNTKGVNLVHKIYAFNKNKAVNESVALNSGLKPFSQVNASQKDINVVNNYGILNELKINDQLIDFNPNLKEFTVLCQTNDVVVYNAKDDKTYKTITNNFISIEKKFIPRTEPKKSYSSSNHRKNKNNANAMYLIVGLMILVIGGGMYYFINQDSPQIDNQNMEINDTIKGSEVTEGAISKGISFYEKPYKGSNRDREYTTEFSKLSNYKFVFAGKKWSYIKKESPNEIMDFNLRVIDDFFNLSDEEKKSFVKELEDISGNPILKEVKVENSLVTPNEKSIKIEERKNRREEEKRKKEEEKKRKKEEEKKRKKEEENLEES